MCIKWRQKETTPKPTSGKNCDFSRYLSQPCCFHLQKVFSVPYRRFFQFHKYSFFQVKWQKKYKKKKNTFPFLSLQKYLREWKWTKNLWSKLPNLYKNSTFLLVILTSMLNQRYYIHLSLISLKKKKNYSSTYLLFKQLKLTGRGSELTDGMCPGMVSMSGYHCVTGFLGFSNIFNHCSRPIPMKSAPIAVQPINSFEPILPKENHGRSMIEQSSYLDYSSILLLTYLS